MAERPTPPHNMFDRPSVQDVSYRLNRTIFEKTQTSDQAAAESAKARPPSRMTGETQAQLTQLIEQQRRKRGR